MKVVSDGLALRQSMIERELGNLALEKVELLQRLDAIDKRLLALRSLHQANDLVLKDIKVDAEVEVAKEAEAAKPTSEKKQ